MYKRVTFYCLFFFVNVLALITFIGCSDKIQLKDTEFKNEKTYTREDCLRDLCVVVFEVDNTSVDNTSVDNTSVDNTCVNPMDYTITPKEDERSKKKDDNQEKLSRLFM